MRRAAWLSVLLTAGCTAPLPPSPEPGPSLSAAPAKQEPDERPWAGTWATAVESGGRSFGKHTLRQIVHTSIGGDTARVRLTNEFGTRPLMVGAVRLARPVSGGVIDPATDRAVTFGGRTSVTIPVGTTAVSDKVSFDVPVDGDVAISAWLPSATGPSTRHGIAVQHNYVAAGEQVSAARLSGVRTETSWFFLSGLDVRGDGGAVVAFGASITDGLGTRSGANERWPDLLSDRLRQAGHRVGVLNVGISGNRFTADGRGESGVNRFERDVLSRPGVRWVIISDDALNDLGAADPPPASRLIATLRQLTARAHSAGVRVICSTLTPYQGAGYWSPQGESGRAEINAFLRSGGSGCDFVLDQDRATHDPAAPARFRAGFDSGDHLHPSPAGMRAIADAADLSWFAG
ncbi:SGNH/GDSL hydrolase family protein [Actinoplanes derwentensis]|uniref:Lysophospholipase L1 n=1 Tax=Actinoplanes derwentensis TaxID=113562 RepID=A0A1H1REI1_9ACTN|nr:SGNH/GDSL hydrolase family protein [Actinoplanes derwentensis]GID89424.1 SGNH hydrolase [Actinoplanes derwentensis]SDS34092.1 Lysophospholipase L1 [Actinoplanes derwentensis]